MTLPAVLNEIKTRVHKLRNEVSRYNISCIPPPCSHYELGPLTFAEGICTLRFYPPTGRSGRGLSFEQVIFHKRSLDTFVRRLAEGYHKLEEMRALPRLEPITYEGTVALLQFRTDTDQRLLCLDSLLACSRFIELPYTTPRPGRRY